jgi:hypothetical protein
MTKGFCARRRRGNALGYGDKRPTKDRNREEMLDYIKARTIGITLKEKNKNLVDIGLASASFLSIIMMV